jgi:hypothetical protein
MKWLIVYACSVNGNPPHILNAVLPEVLPPMNWITMMNREEKDDMANITKRPVLREYSLINYWKVSDYDSEKWGDNGTGYLTLVSPVPNKKSEHVKNDRL